MPTLALTAIPAGEIKRAPLNVWATDIQAAVNALDGTNFGAGALAATHIFRARVSGDSDQRLAIQADGTLLFGTGAATGDVKVSRQSVLDGWTEAGETWTYASADDPTFTFTISGDLTTKYTVGMRVKLTQTTAKYFIITAVSYSSPNTTVTVYGGTDYDLANAAITSPYFSRDKAPLGFPLDPAKWTVETTDAGDRTLTPAAGVWVNPGTLTAVVPIGAWWLHWEAALQAVTSNVYGTLSTANNSESDASLTAVFFGAGVTDIIGTGHRGRFLTLAAKATYYLNLKNSTGGVAVTTRGTVAATRIRAVCAYL